MMLDKLDDTIVAVSTPQGQGQRGIVRLSGPQSLAIATKMFRPDDEAGLQEHGVNVRLSGRAALRDDDFVLPATIVSGFVAGLAGLGLLLLALVAALGRLVVTVDGDRLTISHGWLGLLQKTFDVAKVNEVRVRILSPVATYRAWGWRWGSKGATCYTAGARRGVEIGVGDVRVVISSLNPQMLKEALRPREVAADDRPEYRRVKLKMARRRRIPAHQNWGILDPQKMRSMSA